MEKMVNKKLLSGISVIVGSAIGAGILGIPYIVSQTGFSLGLIHLIIIPIILTIVMLYLGEIALRTKKSHHLTGYAEKYLGPKGKTLMFLTFAFGIFAALIAYLIGEGQSLSQLLFANTNYSFHLALAFWLLLTLLTFNGLKTLARGEKLGVLTIAALILGILIYSINKIDISNLTYSNPSNALLPFGVILFAYLGFATIPEVEEILAKDKNLMKKTIISSYIVMALIYILFTFAVLGWQGQSTPQIATLSLGKVFVLLGILTMATSYLALSNAFIDTLKFDYNIPHKKSWIITSIIPLITYLILTFTNKTNFTSVLGIGGVISGGLTAILILVMIPKAKIHGDVKPAYSIPYNKFLAGILILIFIIGALNLLL